MCGFCATGKGGYSRNLKAHEIIDQVNLFHNDYSLNLSSFQGAFRIKNCLWIENGESYIQVLTIEQLFKHKVSSVVFMGMGEPLLNLPAVLAAHRSLNEVIVKSTTYSL